ncbi:hypothetical protein ID866_5312 [Astraeus odoratus]|nr:hypothetical protein ID866_5312 [Astraeus odoratus]
MSVPSSQVHLPSSSEDGLTSPRKGGKLARFLPKKAASRLSGGPKSTDNLPLSMHDSSVVPFPQRSGGRPSRGKQMPEQNTFHARRKSSALFPAAVAANLHMMDVSNPVNATSGSLIYEPLTDADLGYISDSNIVPSRSHTSPLPPIGPPCAPKLVHARSQTMDGHLYRVPRHAENGNETVQPRPSTPAPPYSVFDEHAMPTAKQLMDASSCFVIAENGIRVPFCDLIKDKKTIVIFIRHFWCPMCQDYMFSVTTAVDPKLLQRADVNLVVIGNGSFNMIKSYRQIFRTPFAVYTDPSMRLHSALGMIRLRKMRPKSQIKRGGYIRHGNVSGLAMVVANAVRVGMPIWEKGGDPAQLGGEFVFGPGLTVSFAHRMPNAGCHAPVQRVLAAAGVGIGCEAPLSTPGPVARTTSLGQDEEQWMEERRMSLARIRERKIARRTGVTFPTCPEVASAEGRSPSSTGHSSIPSPLPDSDKDKGEKSGSATVRTEVTENRSQDSHDAILGTSVEETDTETVSVGSQTLTESDSGSEHTRTEEVEPHQLRDKAALLDLEDLDTAPGVTVSP